MAQSVGEDSIEAERAEIISVGKGSTAESEGTNEGQELVERNLTE